MNLAGAMQDEQGAYYAVDGVRYRARVAPDPDHDRCGHCVAKDSLLCNQLPHGPQEGDCTFFHRYWVLDESVEPKINENTD